MKKCLFCKQEASDEATECTYCGHEVVAQLSPHPSHSSSSSSNSSQDDNKILRAAGWVGAGVGFIIALFNIKTSDDFFVFLMFASIAVAVFVVWMIVDCIKYETEMQSKIKGLCVIIIGTAFTAFFGALVYYFLWKRPRKYLQPQQERESEGELHSCELCHNLRTTKWYCVQLGEKLDVKQWQTSHVGYRAGVTTHTQTKYRILGTAGAYICKRCVWKRVCVKFIIPLTFTGIATVLFAYFLSNGFSHNSSNGLWVLPFLAGLLSSLYFIVMVGVFVFSETPELPEEMAWKLRKHETEMRFLGVAGQVEHFSTRKFKELQPK